MVISLQGDPLNSPMIDGQSARLASERASSEGVDQPAPLRQVGPALGVQVQFGGQTLSDSNGISGRGSTRFPLGLPSAVCLLS